VNTFSFSITDMLEYQIETFISLAVCAIAITSLVRYVKKKIITIIVIGMLASLLSGKKYLTYS
jgi:hypothetical protein